LRRQWRGLRLLRPCRRRFLPCRIGDFHPLERSFLIRLAMQRERAANVPERGAFECAFQLRSVGLLPRRSSFGGGTSNGTVEQQTEPSGPNRNKDESARVGI
jgi:hypothetical protein